MPVENFDIVGSYNHQRVIPLDPERSVNLFEYRDPLGKKPKSLLSTSGLTDAGVFFPNNPSGGFRAQYVFKPVSVPGVDPLRLVQQEYVVIGFNVYKINPNQNANFLFAFTSSSNTSYVGISANTHQLIFVDGNQGWIYDTYTNTSVQITDPAFPTRPIDVTNLDGFFVVANGDTNQWQASSFDNGLIWGVMPATTFTIAGGGTSDIVINPGSSVANLQIGTPVTFTGVPPPAELALNTTYYVVFNDGINIVRVSATLGGAALTYALAGAGNILNGGQLQLAHITSYPGNIVACRVLHRRLYLFSLNFIEVWENQGVGSNLPFRRINSLLIEYGTPAIGSIAVGFEKMFYLSQDEDGLGPVIEITGTSPIPVSTKALDFSLSQYAEENQISDARAFLVKENGIIFYRLNFTAANHTYVYNVTFSDPSSDETKFWHEEEVLNGDRHPAQTHSYFGGKNYVGHYSLPIFYILDNRYFTNNGEAIRRMRISRSFVPSNYNRIRIDRFQLDLLQGSPFAAAIIEEDLILFTENELEILTEDGNELLLEQKSSQQLHDENPVVFLSISKDGGQTFGYKIKGLMGKSGERSYRTLWRKLGTIPRGQGFVVKLEFFDDFPFEVLGAAWAMDVLPE